MVFLGFECDLALKKNPVRNPDAQVNAAPLKAGLTELKTTTTTTNLLISLWSCYFLDMLVRFSVITAKGLLLHKVSVYIYYVCLNMTLIYESAFLQPKSW